MAKKEEETAGIDFLDFLFTVAISVGLITPKDVSDVINSKDITDKGILSQSWLVEGRLPNFDNEFFIFGIFTLAFLNLTLSWFGYHASIKSRPLNYFSGYGMVRFFLDVVLVILYGLALIRFQSFKVVLFIFVLVYVIFIIWDILKICEYWKFPEEKFKDKTEDEKSEERKKYFRHKWEDAKNFKDVYKGFRREFVSLIWGFVFFLLWIFYLLNIKHSIILSLAIFATIAYRFHKILTIGEILERLKFWKYLRIVIREIRRKINGK